MTHLMKTAMTTQFDLFADKITVVHREQKPKVTNVASVPKRSPFRYPGGKTWLIPVVRQWLRQEKRAIPLLIEPFAGGGIVSLTAAFEGLADHTLMTELDPEIGAVWETILSVDNQWLAKTILHFDLTPETAKAAIEKKSEQTRDVAFSTILRNRICHGGIITKGAGMLKNGENGKGIASRWYAKTLHDRITAIQEIKSKLTFRRFDAFQVLDEYKNSSNAYFFIDPPYTVAGKRLYTYFDIDHAKLFELVSMLKGRFMLTYDDTPEIRGLAERFGLPYKLIPMKTTHHLEKNEIIITDNLDW